MPVPLWAVQRSGLMTTCDACWAVRDANGNRQSGRCANIEPPPISTGAIQCGLLCRLFRTRFLGGFGFVRYINQPARESVSAAPPARNTQQLEPLNLPRNGGIDQQL